MKSLFTVAFLFILSGIMAQSSYDLKGVVYDKDNTPLIGATVLILSPVDSIMEAFGSTNESGFFEIRSVKKGLYNMQITYIGYGAFQRNLDLTGKNKVVDLGTILLGQDASVLDEVIVEAEFIPIVVKKDTIEYNADAYRVQPNASVEDLLKKLPGIEVESDGSIKAQGEDVNSVTVDGKKFFGDDPKMATKNIPADAVDKVQVFDKKSEKAEFSGVNDGQETKTINLELKEDKKVGMFGELKGGYGTDDRYEGKLSLNKFNSKMQLAALGGINNVNQQGFSFNEINTLLGGNAFGGGGRFSSPLNIDWGGRSNGNTESASGGLNLNYEFTDKVELNANYFITYLDQFLNESSFTENFNPGTDPYSIDDDLENVTDNLNHNVGMEWKMELDSSQRLDVKLAYKKGSSDAQNLLNSITRDDFDGITNSSDQIELADNASDNRSGEIEYNVKLGKPGRILTLESSYGKTEVDNETFVDRTSELTRNSIVEVDKLLQEQLAVQDNGNYRLAAEYKEPLGNRNYLDLTYSRSNYNNDIIKEFYDLDPADVTVKTFNEILSSTSNNDIIYDRLGLLYTKDSEKFFMSAGANFQHSQLNGEFTDFSPINQSYSYVLPQFNISDANRKFRLRYRTSVNEPSASQLQPVLDNSNPTSSFQGNPDLVPEYRHNINLRFNHFDRFTFRNLFAYINYNYTLNDITNSQIIDPETKFRTIIPVNVSDKHALYGSISAGTPIRPLRIKTRLSTNYNYSRSITFIDSREDNVVTTQPSVRFEFENLDNDYVTVVLSGKYSFNQNKYENNSEQNTDFLTKEYKAEFIGELGKGFNVDTRFSQIIYSEEEFGDNNTVSLWNASLSKGFADNKWRLKVTAFDLLDQNRGIDRAITSTYIQERISNTIGRYFMFSLTYKLSAFNSGGPGIIVRRH